MNFITYLYLIIHLTGDENQSCCRYFSFFITGILIQRSADWNTLFANWTNNAFAGTPLKYSGYSVFNALLSGVRHVNVQWDYQNFATFFWSSTSNGPMKARSHGLNDYNYSVSNYPGYRVNAFSVRCLKD